MTLRQAQGDQRQGFRHAELIEALFSKQPYFTTDSLPFSLSETISGTILSPSLTR